MNNDGFVVGLDIGTTKICALIGEKGADSQLNIMGVGVAPSKGLRKGMVVNIEQTVDSISRAVEDAERKSGVEVTKVFAGIAGGHIKGIDSKGITVVQGSCVGSKDVSRAIDAAKAVAIPAEREVIHVLAQEYVVDEQSEINNPVGMPGKRLEVRVHIVTGAVAPAQNIITCVNRAGFEVEDIVLQPLASARAVLTEEEKDLGVVLIDIGGGTTDIIILGAGVVRHTEILSLGGDHVTNDLAVGLHISKGIAEKLKKEYGCCSYAKGHGHDQIQMKGSRKNFPRGLVSEIIGMRIEEILSIATQEVEKTGYLPVLGSGCILTGGTSLLSGIVKSAGSVFDMPVRIGLPGNEVNGIEMIGRSPVYATAVGLAQYGLEHEKREGGKLTGRNLFSKVTNRMQDWFNDFF